MVLAFNVKRTVLIERFWWRTHLPSKTLRLYLLAIVVSWAIIVWDARIPSKSAPANVVLTDLRTALVVLRARRSRLQVLEKTFWLSTITWEKLSLRLKGRGVKLPRAIDCFKSSRVSCIAHLTIWTAEVLSCKAWRLHRVAHSILHLTVARDRRADVVSHCLSCIDKHCQ